MDYYSTLGVGRNASPDEIKSAYRKMAMKHHPDRGGDEKVFKQVSEAYDVLSDPQKKQIFDLGGDPLNQNARHHHQHGGFNQGPFEFHFGSGNWNDIFGGNFGFGHHQRVQRNKTLNITVDVTFKDILLGKKLDAEISIPGGKSKVINIDIPPGINEGQQIRYQGMGDDSIKNMPAGDLIVNIRLISHPLFKKEGDSLVIEKNISVWDAILGCKLQIETLEDKVLEITVPAGTQSDTVLSCRNEGFPNMRTRQRGNMLIKIRVTIPRHLTPTQVDKIEQLKNEF